MEDCVGGDTFFLDEFLNLNKTTLRRVLLIVRDDQCFVPGSMSLSPAH